MRNSVALIGLTSLDRQNLWNSLKPAIDRQQRKFSKTVSCPTTAVSFPNPNHNLIGKRQEARGEICDSCSCCVGQVAFLDNLLLSVKWRFCLIYFCQLSNAPPFDDDRYKRVQLNLFCCVLRKIL